MSLLKKDPVEQILRLFAEHGHSEYGGEAVTQLEHALQTAHLAQTSGASDVLICASLLHDIGHLLHNLPDDAPDQGIDDRHEDLGARWLKRWFGPEVVDPIQMHVPAKRFLCSVEPEYHDKLSEPSQVSLKLQGGLMSLDEQDQFRSSPHWRAAVDLRRWDDQAKIPGLVVPLAPSYENALRSLVIS